MAHQEQRDFLVVVKSFFPEFFEWQNVLEIGSLNINGTVRDFFFNCNYLGVDIGSGEGVDIVSSGHELKFPDKSFGVTISAECFEHNPYWLETFTEMVRMTRRRDGLVIFTCAGEGRPEHGTTRSDVGSSPLTVGAGWDYYRNLTPADFMTSEYDVRDDFRSPFFFENKKSCDTYFVGIQLPTPTNEARLREMAKCLEGMLGK
jgi:SAM-dependent methyltransferase